MDLLAPSVETSGAFVVAIDAHTRFTVAVHTPGYTTSNLLTAFQKVLLQFVSKPRCVQLDRQSTFPSTNLLDFLVQQQICHKFAPPKHRSEFNPLAERCIQTIRDISRCALTDKNVADIFGFRELTTPLSF